MAADSTVQIKTVKRSKDLQGYAGSKWKMCLIQKCAHLPLKLGTKQFTMSVASYRFTNYTIIFTGQTQHISLKSF